MWKYAKMFEYEELQRCTNWFAALFCEHVGDGKFRSLDSFTIFPPHFRLVDGPLVIEIGWETFQGS